MSYTIGKTVIGPRDDQFDNPTEEGGEYKIIDKFEGKYCFYILMHKSGKLKYVYLDYFAANYRFKDLNYNDI